MENELEKKIGNAVREARRNAKKITPHRRYNELEVMYNLYCENNHPKQRLIMNVRTGAMICMACGASIQFVPPE